MKKIFAGIGILLGIFLFLIFTAIQFFQSDYIQGRIQKKINTSIPGQLKWKHLRLSLIKGEIELADIFLLGSSGDEIAALDRLWINIDWLPLLRREIAIRHFNAKHPQVRIRLEKDGKLNLVRAFSDVRTQEKQPQPSLQGSKKPLPYNLIFKSIYIADGSVSFLSYDEQTDIDIRHIQMRGKGDRLNENAKATLTAKNSIIKTKSVKTGIEHFDLSAAYQKGQIPRLDLTVQTPETTVALTGKVTNLLQIPYVNLKLDAKSALSEITTIFNIKTNLSGLAAIRMNISGPLKNPEATLNLKYDKGILFSQPVDQIRMDLFLKDRMVTFNDFCVYAASGETRLVGSVNLQSVFPHGFFEVAPKVDQLSYDLHLTQQGINIGQFTKTLKTVSGEMSSRINISGKGVLPENLSAKMNLEMTAKNLSSKEVPLIPPVRIIGDATFHQNELNISTLELLSKDASLHAAGKLNLSEKRMTATVELDSPDIQPMASLWGLGNNRGRIQLHAKINGPMNSPQAQIALTGTGLSIGDMILGDLGATAQLNKNGMLVITKLYLKNQGGDLEGQGRLKIFQNSIPQGMSAPLTFSMDFHHIEPRYFFKASPIAGELNGKLTIDGKMNQPVASLKLNGKAVQIQTVVLGDITSTLRFSKGRLYIDRAEVQHKNSSLNMSGDVQLLERHSFKPVKAPFFQLDIKGDRIFLQDILDNNNVKGIFSLKAQVKGHPEDVRGNINLKGSDITLYEQKIESLLLNADLMGDKIQIQPLDIFLSPRESIRLTGWAAQDKSYDFALTTDNVDLKKIQWLTEKADLTEGKLFVHMNGKGTFNAPQINGDIKLTQIQINQKDIKDVSVTLGLEDQIIRISGDVHCDVEGTYNLSDNRFSVRAQFPNTDLSPYFLLFDQPDLSGKLLGKIDISGTADNWSTYSGELDISELEILFKNESLIQGHNLHVLLKDRGINTRDFSLLFANKGHLNINSQIKADESISLVVDGKIPLSVIGIFQKELPEISGDLWINGDIQGTVSSPRMQAEVTIKNLQTVLPYFYQTVYNTEAVIRITPQLIQISSIKGQLDSGSFEMIGQIDLDHWKPVSANVQMKALQLPIAIPDRLDLTLSSNNLSFHGKPEKSIIEGDLIVLDGLYYKDVNLNPLSGISQQKRPSSVSSQPNEMPFIKQVDLNINVKHRKPLSVDNNIARMDIIPDLTIKGTLNHPVINGRMAVQSGEVMYQRKTFVIKKGIIDFMNPYKTEPAIDIRAEHQIRDWLILLNISGKPDQLEFKLSSEPFLEDSDILSLLFLGKTYGELRKNEGGSNPSAAQMLSQLMASTFDKEVKNVTGLDIFEAETSSQENDSGSNGVRVTLGKELTKRITIKYSIQNENGDIVQRAIAEYKLLEEVLLSIFQGNKGVFGGSAKYRLEFQ